MMRWIIGLVLSVLAAGPGAAARTPTLFDYKGADAGYLIVSITAGAGAGPYTQRLVIRRVADSVLDGLSYHAGGWAVKHEDFATDLPGPRPGAGAVVAGLALGSPGALYPHREAGMVMVGSLAPGRYEILDFVEDYKDGVFIGGQVLKFPTPIAFEINAGEGVYLGEFKAIGVTAKNIIGVQRPAGVRYVVTDQGDRDMPIARRKAPAIGAVQVRVPDADQLGSGPFSSKP